MSALRYVPCILALAGTLTVLTGCGDKIANAQTPAGGMPPPEVSIVTVAPQRLVMTTELPGRIEATRVAQVRARVPGIVLKRVFKEGTDVKAGEVLFRIDAGPYQATFNSTVAAVAKAEANLAQANLKAQRYKPLVETNAISKQEYDDALTSQKQATADLATAKATQETARLNLGYATVTAPISGRIGRAQVTEGALVGQGEATPLATIQQLDPVFVNLTQSSTDALKLRRALANGQLKRVGKDEAKVTLLSEDGSPYPHAGKLLFSDVAVDESSGAVTLRAEFPNPDRMMLPGMYVRAQLEQAVTENAITVPQQAVTRDMTGASVMLVGADGKVVARPIKTERSQGNSWVVSEGLKEGDRVIVEGLQKVKPGAEVKPVPWKAASAPQSASVTSPNGGANGAAPAGQQNTK